MASGGVLILALVMFMYSSTIHIPECDDIGGRSIAEDGDVNMTCEHISGSDVFWSFTRQDGYMMPIGLCTVQTNCTWSVHGVALERPSPDRSVLTLKTQFLKQFSSGNVTCSLDANSFGVGCQMLPLSAEQYSNTDKGNPQEISTEKGNTSKCSTEETNPQETTEETNPQETSTEKGNALNSSTEETNPQETSTEKGNASKCSTEETNPQETSTEKGNASKSSTEETNPQETSTEKGNALNSSTEEINPQETSIEKENTPISSTEKTNPQEPITEKGNSQETSIKEGNPQTLSIYTGNLLESSTENLQESSTDKGNSQESSTEVEMGFPIVLVISLEVLVLIIIVIIFTVIVILHRKHKRNLELNPSDRDDIQSEDDEKSNGRLPCSSVAESTTFVNAEFDFATDNDLSHIRHNNEAFPNFKRVFFNPSAAANFGTRGTTKVLRPDLYMPEREDPALPLARNSYLSLIDDEVVREHGTHAYNMRKDV